MAPQRATVARLAVLVLGLAVGQAVILTSGHAAGDRKGRAGVLLRDHTGRGRPSLHSRRYLHAAFQFMSSTQGRLRGCVHIHRGHRESCACARLCTTFRFVRVISRPLALRAYGVRLLARVQWPGEPLLGIPGLVALCGIALHATQRPSIPLPAHVQAQDLTVVGRRWGARPRGRSWPRASI
jgi:hypothetical protein